jgi:hypothetical protein
MHKYKKHFVSIFLIIIMLIFALSTSVGRVDASLIIKNNSSYNLKFKISGSDYGHDGNRRDIYEEFTLNIGQVKIIDISGRNDYYAYKYIYDYSNNIFISRKI